nr:MAG TPA: DNA helix destabilizing protein [Caudoviricetes sp.]
MANYNKVITATSVRLGEVRFSYASVFAPRKNEDGSDGKYSVMLLIPKSDAQAKKLIEAAVEAAKQAGVQSKWSGKMPSAAKLHLPLRDGDDEFPDDPTYEGMWFMNASSTQKPGVRVLENGAMSEALDSDDFYSGCWGAVVVNFFPYSVSGNVGVAAGLNNLIKTRDDERLGGGRSADADFGDMASGSCLD